MSEYKQVVRIRRIRRSKWGAGVFNEICIYEAKIDKQDEIETLMKEVAEFYLSQPGVIDVKYVKRTHRQEDFNAVKEGKPPIRLTKWVGKVTYILHWTLEDEETHARVSKLGLERFYKRWNRCLTTMPKILLGENIV
ncbi:hypothetical protein [Pseudoflavonifractor phocaeensis]|uniref:hypothetical protein n=1 Tax=Pseudoflavonifractor phocaeensis TaxID=1870988 RepID=UPI003CC7AAB8